MQNTVTSLQIPSLSKGRGPIVRRRKDDTYAERLPKRIPKANYQQNQTMIVQRLVFEHCFIDTLLTNFTFNRIDFHSMPLVKPLVQKEPKKSIVLALQQPFKSTHAKHAPKVKFLPATKAQRQLFHLA